MTYFAVYRRDNGTFELRQLSGLAANAKDSRLVGTPNMAELQSWLRNRRLALVAGDEITPESVLHGLDLWGSAKFTVIDDLFLKCDKCGADVLVAPLESTGYRAICCKQCDAELIFLNSEARSK